VPNVPHKLEETSKTFEKMKRPQKSFVKIVSTSRFEKEIHIAPPIKQKVPETFAAISNVNRL
jgi:hypothetical protein